MQKLLGVLDLFIILIVRMLLWVYNYVKIYEIVLWKYVWFIIDQLHLSKFPYK